MKVLDANAVTNTIIIIPRSYDSGQGITVEIKRDGYGTIETVVPSAITKTSNYLTLDCEFTILQANSMYYYEVFNGATLIFRDKAIVSELSINDSEFIANSSEEDQEFISYD